jgi:peroxiredoxin
MRLCVCAFAFLGLAGGGAAQSLEGLWDATVVVDEIEIPFRIEFAGSGRNVQGWFFNGEEKVPSTSGNFADGRLQLSFDHYATRLGANLRDGILKGRYDRGARGYYPFRAKRFVPSAPPAGEVPPIAGLWEVEVRSPKGESAWRLIVRQTGPEVSAAVLRVDGDTGLLTGTWRDGRFVLSHFSGARPNLLEITPAKDGSLELLQNGKNRLLAVRSRDARAQGLPQPADPSRHTSVRDPSEPFQFSLPDLEGKIVSNTDVRFRGKAVLVVITGSWCPNCHDEAPFLEQLYRKYRDQGLEIVALSFEEAEQLRNPTRLRAFIRQYGIDYTVLLGGEPEQLHDKLPQAVNLNSWPTTFFLGRDGRVRSVHAGFAGAASGEFYTTQKEEITAIVERLLLENTSTER